MDLIPISGKEKINPAGRIYGRLTVINLAGYIRETRNKEEFLDWVKRIAKYQNFI